MKILVDPAPGAGKYGNDANRAVNYKGGRFLQRSARPWKVRQKQSECAAEAIREYCKLT